MVMIGLPIEWIFLLIITLIAALVVFTVYMVWERNKENKKRIKVIAYLEKNREGWYTYIRTDGMVEEDLIPKNEAEVTAIEELFRSLVQNLKGDGIEKRISLFANRHLADAYRKKLRGHNWGERMNVLYHIYDFGIDSLTDECKKLSKRRISPEEFFLVLLIKLKFNADSFIENNLQKLNVISSNYAKELLYSMPENLFKDTMTQLDQLDKEVHYDVVDVIGMKHDSTWVPMLESMFSETDSELRIRILRAFNTLSVVPADAILADATSSDVWQERYQVARMLRWLPKKDAILLAKGFLHDNAFLVREEARIYMNSWQVDADVFSYVAATTAEADEKRVDVPNLDDHLISQTTKLPNEKGGD